MIKVVLSTYIFIRWTGGWGVHDGFWALVFLALWTAFMVLVVCMAALGPLLTIVSIARLFHCDAGNIRVGLVNAVKTPAGRTLLFGHWATMGISAVVCYIGYFFSGSIAPCLLHWSKPMFFEWLVLAWFIYSAYTFIKVFR